MQVLEAHRLLALLGVGEVRRLAADHAGHDPVAREDLHPLPHEHLGIPAARLDHVQEALVAHVAHEQGDLVHVAHDGEQRMLRAAVHARDRRAEPVHRDVVREPLRGLAPDACGLALVARRAGGGEQLQEEVRCCHSRRG
jgi:hypothetical protein